MSLFDRYKEVLAIEQNDPTEALDIYVDERVKKYIIDTVFATRDPAAAGMNVVVADVDGHHDRAVAAGAGILIPLVDQDYGGRGYSCRDPEGQVWSFGSYDPMAE